MVRVASLPAFFVVVVVVAVAMYLINRRYEVESALVAALGAGIIGLYFIVVASLTLFQ